MKKYHVNIVAMAKQRKPRGKNTKRKNQQPGFNTAIGYVCKVLFDSDLGEGNITVYPTEAALREAHPHSDECGIVEVAIVLRTIVKEIDLDSYYNRLTEINDV